VGGVWLRRLSPLTSRAATLWSQPSAKVEILFWAFVAHVTQFPQARRTDQRLFRYWLSVISGTPMWCVYFTNRHSSGPTDSEARCAMVEQRRSCPQSPVIAFPRSVVEKANIAASIDWVCRHWSLLARAVDTCLWLSVVSPLLQFFRSFRQFFAWPLGRPSSPS